MNPCILPCDMTSLWFNVKQQPLSASFDRMVQAMGVFDQWAETQRARGKSPSTDADHWGFNAVESIIWDAVGMGLLLPSVVPIDFCHARLR
jgi:hypothetical protein